MVPILVLRTPIISRLHQYGAYMFIAPLIYALTSVWSLYISFLERLEPAWVSRLGSGPSIFNQVHKFGATSEPSELLVNPWHFAPTSKQNHGNSLLSDSYCAKQNCDFVFIIISIFY